MKTLTIALSIILLAGIGCKTARKVQVIAEKMDTQRISKQEQAAIRAVLPPYDPTYPTPAITHETRYASICPYCDTVNLSDFTSKSGGYVVVSNQFLTVVAGGGVVTNVISQSDGFLENWSMSYTCSNCGSPYSDYRDQLVPRTRSVRLPIRQQ